MKTTEAIEIFKTRDVADDQGYNILIENLYDCEGISPESIANPVAQQLIRFYMYQIQSVLFPVIRDLRTLNAQMRRGGQIFKDELDAQDQKGIK